MFFDKFINTLKALKAEDNQRKIDDHYEGSFIKKYFEITENPQESFTAVCRPIMTVETRTGEGFHTDTYDIYETKDNKIIVYIIHYHFRNKYSSGWFKFYSVIHLNSLQELYDFCMKCENTSKLMLYRQTKDLFKQLGFPNESIDVLPKYWKIKIGDKHGWI